MDDEAGQLLALAKRMLEQSVKSGELEEITTHSLSVVVSSVYQNIGLFHWLAENRHDEESFTKSYEAAFLEKNYHADKEALDIIIFQTCAARGYQQVCDTFERYYKRPIKDLNKIANSSCLSYCIAQYRLNKLSDWNREKSMDYFLRRRINDLFSIGYIDWVFLWLKMRYWDYQDPAVALTPGEVIRKVYDYMPQVRKPDF